VQDVGVEAERLEEGRVHNVDCVIQAGASAARVTPVRSKFKCFYPERTGATPRRHAEAQAYLASRWRKPKPSERVLVAVNVSNSTGAGYGVAAVAAWVW
jgi:hypothetical protein